MKTFYHIIANTFIASLTTFVVWFALTFFVYLETKSVFATSVLAGVYLILMSSSSFWFGSIVDHHRKKSAMIFSSSVTLVIFSIAFAIYLLAPAEAFTSVSSPILWIFSTLILMGVIFGNIRNIALATLVTILVPEHDRDKANGLVGMVNGVTFLVVSVISGFLVAQGGMFYVMILSISLTLAVILHLLLLHVPEEKIVHTAEKPKKVDIRGTIAVISTIPGLFALIFFTTFNNFLGGAFMSLMDAYGLSLVSVQMWGIVWGILSTAFIVGGIIISKFGLGKNPLRSLFLTNITIWTVSMLFTVQPSIILLMVGMFIYLAVVPFIEASEHTIMQKVVPFERQGRVMGFAQSVEMAVSPLMAFLIGPLAQFFFIPFMSEGGQGAELIGSWFGVGTGRGIALVFTVIGIVGLCVTLIAMRSRFYTVLSKQYQTALSSD